MITQSIIILFVEFFVQNVNNIMKGLFLMNKVIINISGKDHTVVTDESPNYIKSLARRLNKHIELVSDNNPHSSTSEAVALVALSYLDELEKASASLEELRTKNVALADSLANVQSKLSALKSDNSIEPTAESTKNPQNPTGFDEKQLKLG